MKRLILFLILTITISQACCLIRNEQEFPIVVPPDSLCDKFIYSVVFRDGYTCMILWGYDRGKSEGWVECPYSFGRSLVESGEDQGWPFAYHCDRPEPLREYFDDAKLYE